MAFMGDAIKNDDWSGAIGRNYGFADLGKLQNTWLAWVKRGSPPLKRRVPTANPVAPAEMLAGNTSPTRTSTPLARRTRPGPNLIHREPAERLESYAPAGTIAATNTGPTRVIPAGRLVALDSTVQSKQLPSSAWHAAGEAAASRSAGEIRPISNPFRLQVSRPQPMESPRQIILEWQER